MAERLDAFMARANAAYYATRDPFADFTTAPEVSQVFGEILGLWAAVVWELLGSPRPVLLTEAGPGRGTLVADALRAITEVRPAFRDALRLHLVEFSPRLRALQAEALGPLVAGSVTWHDSLTSLPDGPLLLLANEFLDALPVRHFVRRGLRWTERHVEAGAFVEVPATGIDRPAPDGAIVEVCEPACELAFSLGQRLTRHSGAALLLDYGYERSSTGETLQAIRGGQPADPLAEPGSADLTAHVDFATFAAAARRAGAAVYGPVPQGLFLARLGLFQRTGRLARGQPVRRAAALIETARRLAEPDRMGRLFKAIAVCHPGLLAPPGFEPEIIR
jgi:NADH dehydrogenase [ubiquinone] 1 alpha subcomplex assembly factor 7